MKFLANENFPLPSILKIRSKDIEVLSVAEEFQGISDEEVMRLAITKNLTILTHDSDYGELIFRHGYRPKCGVIYFRLTEFEPEEPGNILLDFIAQKKEFESSLIVIDRDSIRSRIFS